MAWKSAFQDPISITFGHWVPGIVGTIGLFMYVAALENSYIYAQIGPVYVANSLIELLGSVELHTDQLDLSLSPISGSTPSLGLIWKDLDLVTTLH